MCTVYQFTAISILLLGFGISDESSNLKELQLRLLKFEPTWQEYEDVQSQIELINEGEEQTIERENFEDQYFKLIANVENYISDKQRPALQNISNVSNSDHNLSLQVKLPTLNLPSFNGQYQEWLSFYDTFNSLINDNGNLTNIQKFHYLKSTLVGEAANVIASLGVSGDNYNTAWQLLRKRYENKRLIIKNHIDALFNLPSVTKESAPSLRQSLDTVNTHLRALKTLGMPTDSWDVIIIHLLTLKFDYSTNREWESLTLKNDLPAMEEMTNFLSRRCQMLESLSTKTPFQKYSPMSTSLNKAHVPNKINFRSMSHVAAQKMQSCHICKQNHSINQCTEFQKLPTQERFQVIKNNKLCVNCFKGNHQTINCIANIKCKYCSKRHNSLLHFETQVPQITETFTNMETNIIPIASTSTINHCREIQGVLQVLHSTALIYVRDDKGKRQACRALLDVGSQSNFITEDLYKKLNLKSTKINTIISGVTQTATKITQSVQVHIKSHYSSFTANIICLIIAKITENLPLLSFAVNQLEIPKNIKLADPAFNVSKQIDMLLGAELFWNLLCNKQIKLSKNQPYLQETLLGWIVGGTLRNWNNLNTTSCNLSLRTLDQKLTRFWEIEEYPNIKTLLPVESECEVHFQTTHSQNLEGRFVVKLPFKENRKPLGLSRDYALKRLFTLENKFSKNPPLGLEYKKCMTEYLELGHMELVPTSKVEPAESFYLPHHAVLKQSSLTTKLRVVFDGSAKTSTGMSLNDNLMVGPTIQEDLFSILIRFRTYKYVFTADITKMYRQITINPQDRDFQRILWRNERNEEIKTYRLTTVTYGTTSAPFLAIRCLQQIAINNKDKFPLAHSAILENFYVDDVLTGANSITGAKILRDQLIRVLSSGGFELCKFVSNDTRLLPDNQNNIKQSNIINLNPDSDTKTLGLLWNTYTDIFKYSLDLSNLKNKSTKRLILSVTSQIFDPLGLIGPVLIKAKIIIQRLWSLKLGWDEAVAPELHNQWSQFANELSELPCLTFPRKIIPKYPYSEVEIHGFCDASEVAYGACVYLRITDTYKNHHVHLICAKSRVAPLKKISIPRLELCGALLLARLLKKTIKILSVNINKQHCWTDSSIVLAWLTRPSNLKTFVANRVSEILSLTKLDQWRHVNSEYNPADFISRGMSPQQLSTSRLWCSGPEWLSSDYQNWPKNNINVMGIKLIEQKESKLCYPSIVIPEFEVIDKYFTITKLRRVVAYCLRFAYNCKNSSNKRTENLTCQELNQSNIVIIKIAQAHAFSKELSDLKKHNQVTKSSKLIALNPFLDNDGILRVGGRLKNACLNYNQTHPILLPQKHHVTYLIITHTHVKQLHAGPQAMLAILRQKYWPLSGRSVVRQILHKCIKCYRAKPSSINQIMGDLPKHRVKPARPFIHSGVDYAGPIYIKEGHGTSRKVIKSYIALFICFATKAIHLELVCDLTSESFLNALKRFMSRRGKLSHIYSDNATTFTGANRELNLELKKLFSNQTFNTGVIESLANDNITWHFIPPRSPHFGGLWEAGIRSVKHHLKRIIGVASLTYDEMYTLLTQIEACLNSRPLTPLSDTPDDLTILTPSHFLIGDSLVAPIEPDITQIKMNRLSRWQRVQQLLQHFWKRWSSEYLGQLQTRKKWQHYSNCNLGPNTMVILKDDQLPPLQWLLGRIVEVHPGRDGVIRAATVKTKNGVVKRATTKLCLLPIDNDDLN